MRRLVGAKQLGEHNYVITAGDSPRCTCPDLSRRSYPCKHLIQTWLNPDGELSVPDTLSNPWWTADNLVLPEQFSQADDPPMCSESPLCDSQPMSVSHNESDNGSVEDDEVKSQNDHERDLLKVHSLIRESLKQVAGFTHENQSLESANAMLSQLNQIKHTYLSNAKTLSNIPVIKAPTSISKAKKRKAIRHQDSVLKPKRRKPMKYSKHGMLSGYIVSDLHSCEAPEQTVSHMSEPLSSQTTASLLVAEGDIKVEKQIVKENPATKKIKKKVSSNQKAVDISFVLDPQQLLDSDVITEGLNLMTKQFPEVQTQDCLLIQRPRCFDPVLEYNHGDFCQVLHMSSAGHWVSVTNIAARDNDVRYFDSLGLTPTLKITQAVASEYSI